MSAKKYPIYNTYILVNDPDIQRFCMMKNKPHITIRYGEKEVTEATRMKLLNWYKSFDRIRISSGLRFYRKPTTRDPHPNKYYYVAKVDKIPNIENVWMKNDYPVINCHISLTRHTNKDQEAIKREVEFERKIVEEKGQWYIGKNHLQLVIVKQNPDGTQEEEMLA